MRSFALIHLVIVLSLSRHPKPGSSLVRRTRNEAYCFKYVVIAGANIVLSASSSRDPVSLY